MADKKVTSRKDRGRYDKSVYQSFALIMQFGINMLVPICLMSALGIFLDRKLGTSYIMVILFFVGAIAGAQNVYRMAKRVYEKEPDQDGRESTAAKKGSGSRDEGDRDAEKGE